MKIKDELSDFELMVLEDVFKETGLSLRMIQEDKRNYLYAVRKFWERRLE